MTVVADRLQAKPRRGRKLARFGFKSKLFIKLVVIVNALRLLWITWFTREKSAVYGKDKALGKLCMRRSPILDKNPPLDNFLTFPQSVKKLFRTLSTGNSEIDGFVSIRGGISGSHRFRAFGPRFRTLAGEKQGPPGMISCNFPTGGKSKRLPA
ncbi:hypothetical protein [Herbaspirillum sp. C9C3]|uniref:hypothetical protein n=1 Tax=Herbaspirillum sp. C9C3 TaxID=2735271 RepID=UPI0015849634|nr:hypothetical protein [Herbaspirillum sp. C9C3]NUT62714.1 hypothetical protein [Herbaspirillum sp. C9C3]